MESYQEVNDFLIGKFEEVVTIDIDRSELRIIASIGILARGMLWSAERIARAIEDNTKEIDAHTNTIVNISDDIIAMIRNKF